MRLPFTVNRRYLTHLTEPQIGQFLEYLRAKERRRGFFSVPAYNVETRDGGFTLQRRSLSRNEPAFPKIMGRICRHTPTVLELSIKPVYAAVVMHALIPAFAVGAVTVQQHLSIAAVFKSPGIFERLFWVSLAGLVAIIACYFSVLMPVADAELWLVKKLSLKELPAASSGLTEE